MKITISIAIAAIELAANFLGLKVLVKPGVKYLFRQRLLQLVEQAVRPEHIIRVTDRAGGDIRSGVQKRVLANARFLDDCPAERSAAPAALRKVASILVSPMTKPRGQRNAGAIVR